MAERAGLADTRGDGGRNGALDGIRAVAVLAVMLHHAGVDWAGGGFLGVDSFFVLSGFLITGLLLDERFDRGRVDLAAFWARRARRLLPALLVVVAVVGIAHAGNTAAARSIRLDAAATIGYVANWRFLFTDADYFARTGDPSPLQHAWSLGIEEQFYVLWPLVLAMLLGRRHLRGAQWRLAGVAGAGIVASAVLMAVLFRADAPARAYYGTDTRAQSILVGVLLAVLVRTVSARRLRASTAGRATLEGAAVAGIGVTAWLWWQVDGGTPALYRGGFLLASVASALVVACVALLPRGALGRTLGVLPLRALGRISYGVYLWHWPIQLAVTNRATGWSGPPLIVGRMVLTIAVATASFLLIEEPIRRRASAPRPTLVGFAVSSCVVAAIVGIVLVPTDEQRLVASAATTSTSAAATTSTVITTSTTVDPALGAVPPATSSTSAVPAAEPVPPPPPAVTTTVAILGDSVAQSLARGLAGPGEDVGIRALDDAILGCGVARSGEYTLSGITSGLADECTRWDEIWASYLARDQPDVAAILVGRHEVLDRVFEGRETNLFDQAYADYLRSELDTAISVAGSTGARVVVLTAPYYVRPEAPDGNPWPENDPARVDVFNDLLRGAAASRGVAVIDLGGHTNPGGRYASTVDGVRMRRDGVHYSAEACAWLAPWLAPQLQA